MFRLYSSIIIIVCVTKTDAFNKQKQFSCGENESLSPCANRVCEYRKCSDIGGPIQCINVKDPQCRRGCVCIDGYLRADNGRCILASQCPNARRCLKENEYYEVCPQRCPERTCVGINNGSIICPEPLQAGDPACPSPECRCRPGFYRDSSDNCVPWYLCQTCREDERPTSCIQGRCERRDCSDIPKPVVCVRIIPEFCTTGCLCREGLLRSANGTCIPITQCPEARCGDNEIFDECPPGCPGEDCGIDPSVVLCLSILPFPSPGDPSCQPSCRCVSGYRRNSKGRCIPQNQCPPPCGVNEVYDDCISSCPARRCDVDDTLLDCAAQPLPGDPACTAGCRCADNFYRNSENICVTRSECPPLCGPNEVYDSCIRPCPPERCSFDPRLALCPANQACQAGCRCIDTFARDGYGFCIPRNQCGTKPIPPKRSLPTKPPPRF